MPTRRFRLAATPGCRRGGSVRLILLAAQWMANWCWMRCTRSVADRARREHLRHWFAGVLLGHSALDWGSGALISLLHMLGATSVVVGGPVAMARATTIANGDWPADVVTRAMAEDCAEIVLSWTSGDGGPTATVPTWSG